MASLTSLQGTGGGRIPMGGFSSDVSRHDLTRIIDSMPTQVCREMHLAVGRGDTATAQRLLCAAHADPLPLLEPNALNPATGRHQRCPTSVWCLPFLFRRKEFDSM